MLARDIAARNPGALFVADVKSTGLFLTDPVLKQHGAKTKFWKTGHSYIKRYSHADRRAGRLREVRTFLLQPAARPRL